MRTSPTFAAETIALAWRHHAPTFDLWTVRTHSDLSWPPWNVGESDLDGSLRGSRSVGNYYFAQEIY